MPPSPETSVAPISSNRLWAEQLAMGLGLLLALLVFMAVFHATLLSIGAQVLTKNQLAAYGWAAVAGVVVQLFVHEGGTLLVARVYHLPLRFRFFPFGAHATAILQDQPRRIWVDAVVGIAGPMTGALFSTVLGLITALGGDPFFLTMACVGYFYNLFTLIPILDLEGGWIAPAIAPPVWLLGLVACVMALTHGFNLVLLCVVCFGVPRLILLIRARAPRTDTACTTRQRVIIGGCYFVLVICLAWFGSSSFQSLTVLIPEAMGD